MLVRRFCSVWLGPSGELTLGDRVFLNNGCSIACRGRVTVGADTLFGEGVRVYDHNHKFRGPDTPIRDQGYTVGEVRVGRNCWVGSGVILLKGADVGDHCVIGAGCVVAGPVPPHTVVRLDPAVRLTPMASA
ncbi:MAG: acyltransferase [Gemmataceae bacterium]